MHLHIRYQFAVCSLAYAWSALMKLVTITGYLACVLAGTSYPLQCLACSRALELGASNAAKTWFVRSPVFALAWSKEITLVLAAA
jgi:hypothetical protein